MSAYMRRVLIYLDETSCEMDGTRGRRDRVEVAGKDECKERNNALPGNGRAPRSPSPSSSAPFAGTGGWACQHVTRIVSFT